MESTRHEDRFMKFHPRNIMLVVLLFGLSMLFLALTIAYAYTRATTHAATINVPILFLLNTMALLASSYTMVQAQKAYLSDDTQRYQQQLLYTILLSLSFTAMQCVTWYWLFKWNAVTLASSVGAGYLYVLSSVHLLHVLGGLPFLIYFYRASKKHMIDPVTVLVYFSDPEKRMNLKILTIYWHFLDILWIYLVLFLGVMSFF